MGKILALDIGAKRVGYAVSDESQQMAFPRESISAISQNKLIDHLRIIIKEEGISKIVIGLPLGEDNEETKNAVKIKQFGEKLARLFMLPIFYVDEFGSTQEALSKIPFRADRRKKGGDDAIAALIILQRYIESKK